MNSKNIRLIPLDYDGIERLKELYEDGHGGFWIYDAKKVSKSTKRSICDDRYQQIQNGFRYVKFISYAYTSFSMFASTSNDFFEREWITFIEPGRYFIVEINGKIGGQI